MKWLRPFERTIRIPDLRLRPCVWCLGHISDETNSREHRSRRRSCHPEPTEPRPAPGQAVIKFVSQDKTFATFRPTKCSTWRMRDAMSCKGACVNSANGDCECECELGSKLRDCCYCILITAFSKLIVYPHTQFVDLFLQIWINKWPESVCINEWMNAGLIEWVFFVFFSIFVWHRSLMSRLWRQCCLQSKVYPRQKPEKERKSAKSETQFKNHYERTLSVKN